MFSSLKREAAGQSHRHRGGSAGVVGWGAELLCAVSSHAAWQDFGVINWGIFCSASQEREFWEQYSSDLRWDSAPGTH